MRQNDGAREAKTRNLSSSTFETDKFVGRVLIRGNLEEFSKPGHTLRSTGVAFAILVSSKFVNSAGM
jgi:hypothetical protein